MSAPKQDRHIEKTGPKEIGWLILLWLLSVAAAGLLAAVVRFVLGA